MTPFQSGQNSKKENIDALCKYAKMTVLALFLDLAKLRNGYTPFDTRPWPSGVPSTYVFLTEQVPETKVLIFWTLKVGF